MALKRLRTIAATALIAGAGVLLNAPSVSAATVTIYNDDEVNTAYSITVRATVDCSGCEVLTFGDHNNALEVTDLYSYSASYGEIFDGASATPPPGNSLQEEVDWLNFVNNTELGLGSATKDESTVNGVAYTITGEYAIVKVGVQPNYTILKNTSGTDSFTFTWNGGSNAGLSHTTTISAVPVPAAGFLLIGALGSLVALRRRRKSA